MVQWYSKGYTWIFIILVMLALEYDFWIFIRGAHYLNIAQF